jgi:hypothetical protein
VLLVEEMRTWASPVPSTGNPVLGEESRGSAIMTAIVSPEVLSEDAMWTLPPARPEEPEGTRMNSKQ